MIIGFFGTEDDRHFDTRLREMVGANKLMASFTKLEYAAQVVARIRKYELDSIICTDPSLLPLFLGILPGFKVPRTETGREKKLSMNDYHGSLIRLPADITGHTKDTEVLFLNPLRHLMTVPSAPFIFKRFISKITKPTSWCAQTPFTYEVLDVDTTAGELRAQELLALMESAVLVAADIETDRGSELRTINCTGYCFLRADGASHSFSIPLNSMRGVEWMRKFNATPAPKVMAGGTYDAVYFLRYNAPLTNWTLDIQNLFHSYYAELPKRLDFVTAYAVREVYFWKDDSRGVGSLEHFEYNCRDCWATLNACVSLLIEMPDWANKNYHVEFPLNFPNISMELDGLQADMAKFHAQLADVNKRIDASLARMRTWIGDEFNPRSPVQCKALLEVLGYRDSKGETADSSDEATIMLASAAHPINEVILSEVLEYRGLAKLRDTYLVESKLYHGRLYSRLNAHGTESGRFSSSESSFWCGFNGQNMAPEVKEWVEADEGYLLAEADFAQAEARCVGYLSGCKALIDLVESPNDYHSWNASAFFGIPYADIWDQEKGKAKMKPLRDLSKRVNHGNNYNMRKFMLYMTMGPKEVAKARTLLKLDPKMDLLAVCQYLLQTYEKTYPEVKGAWYSDIKRKIKLMKKMVSPTGRTRYFFGDLDKSRDAMNSAVANGPQGLSVDLLNRGLMRVWRSQMYGELKGHVRLKLQIHDSLFFCYRNGQDKAETVRAMMHEPIPVTDIKGVTRTMLIPPDLNCGKKYWSELK